LNERGSELIYSTYIGGSGPDTSGGVAVDSAGNVYVTGSTNSFNFPLASPLQNRKLSSALFKSTDAGISWSDVPLTLFAINQIVPDPQTLSTFYAWGPGGIIKSTDKGNSWTSLGSSPAGPLVIDRLNPSTIYVFTGLRVYKSTDSGTSWRFAEISSGNTLDSSTGLVIDPKNTSTLYLSTTTLPIAVPAPMGTCDAPVRSSVFKSTDGGNTWVPLDVGLPRPSAISIAVDPQDPSTLYISVGLEPNAYIHNLTISRRAPTTLYASTFNDVFKSTDGGNHWGISLKELQAGRSPLILTMSLRFTSAPTLTTMLSSSRSMQLGQLSYIRLIWAASVTTKADPLPLILSAMRMWRDSATRLILPSRQMRFRCETRMALYQRRSASRAPRSKS
jgi:hypothetical protein